MRACLLIMDEEPKEGRDGTVSMRHATIDRAFKIGDWRAPTRFWLVGLVGNSPDFAGTHTISLRFLMPDGSPGPLGTMRTVTTPPYDPDRAVCVVYREAFTLEVFKVGDKGGVTLELLIDNKPAASARLVLLK